MRFEAAVSENTLHRAGFSPCSLRHLETIVCVTSLS